MIKILTTLAIYRQYGIDYFKLSKLQIIYGEKNYSVNKLWQFLYCPTRTRKYSTSLGNGVQNLTAEYVPSRY